MSNQSSGISLVGLGPGASAILTVKTNRVGYLEATASISGSAQPGNALEPRFNMGIRLNESTYTIQISNMDPRYLVSATTTLGAVSVSSSGLVTVSGLKAGDNSVVEVIFSRPGYYDGKSAFGLSFGG